MKYMFAFLLVCLLLLAACVIKTETSTQTRIVTSADDPGPEGSIHNLPKGCYVMKKRTAEIFDCFGCVGDVCKDEILEIWEYYDQDVAATKGYSCVEAPSGCQLR